MKAVKVTLPQIVWEMVYLWRGKQLFCTIPAKNENLSLIATEGVDRWEFEGTYYDWFGTSRRLMLTIKEKVTPDGQKKYTQEFEWLEP